MQFRELPSVYARLAGFLAGSAVQHVAEWLPEPTRHWVGGVLSPLATGVTGVLPKPVRRGLRLACERSGRDQPPVLIVPGFLGPSFLLVPLAIFLRAHGRRVEQLHNFPALDGVEALARRIAEAVERLKAETGAERVDLVTHSMGGLSGRYYLLKLDGRQAIRRFITIATPHHGTRWARFPFGRSCADMTPGSAMLHGLAADKPIEDVRCINIRAGWDQIVWPRERARWAEHVSDHELPWSEHWAVQVDPRLLALVLTSLEASDEALPSQPVLTLTEEMNVDDLGSAG